MAIRGDDFSADGRRDGFAILGTGSPSSIPVQGGGNKPVNDVGVYGAVGDPGAVAELIDDITVNFAQKVTAGVAGAFVPKPPAGAGADTAALGFLAGGENAFGQLTGVYGESTQQGVFGVSKGRVGTGVVGLGGQTGTNLNPDTGGKGVFGSAFIGVMGNTQTGAAVLGRSFGPGLAGLFQGDVRVEPSPPQNARQVLPSLKVIGSGEFLNGSLAVTFDIHARDVILAGGDCAEDFDVVDDEAVESGSVMVIDDEGTLRTCQEPYDKRVAGIVSGAGGHRPGVTLDRQAEIPAPNRLPIALVGKVHCKADARYGRIMVGDLLTTSPTPGHAMRADDPVRAFGAVIGKALRPLEAGQALIPILVALQ